MSVQFNLLEEPWIPCLLPDGRQQPLGLRDALTQAHAVAAIAGESPPVSAALYRLLLAVVHRCCGSNGETGPRNAAAWEALWRRGAFDTAAISAYVDRWRERFDLFSTTRPFYQTAAPSVSADKSVSIAKLLFQSDNNPTLFDHLVVAHPPSLGPARAARLLVSYQGFDTAGLITGTGVEKSAKASPLLQRAVIIVRGRTLFETLMLNLVRYDPRNGAPWEFDPHKDRPAWEREDDVQAKDRAPDGYLDLLTWQSRRIRLWAEDVDGRVIVRRATVMKGFQFPDGWPLYERETMVAFGRNLNAKGTQNPYPPLGFQEDRSLWRDSLVLLEPESAGGGHRPRTLEWLGTLAMHGVIEDSQLLPVDALGLAADRAKLLFWRHERLALPLAYLDQDKGRYLLEKLRQALGLAEDVGRLMRAGFIELPSDGKPLKLPSPFRVLADELPGGISPEVVVQHYAPGRTYWAALDEPFRTLLEGLPSDVREEGSDLEYGETLMPVWREALRSAARQAFDEVAGGLEQSARAMRAVALADRRLRYLLSALLGPVAGATRPAVAVTVAGGDDQ